MTTYTDDRFEGVDSADEAIDVAREIVGEMAADHAPEAFCSACVRNTPLACESARDVPKANSVDAVISDAASFLGDTEWWVHDEVSREYIREFHENSADPEDCEVCKHGLTCGHIQNGESCPVRHGEACPAGGDET